MREKRPRILIFGGIPAEAGGRGNDGLSYSIWNSVRRIKSERLEIIFVPDNMLPREGRIGHSMLLPFRPGHLWPMVLSLPTMLVRVIQEPYLRINLTTIGKFFWYATCIDSIRPDLVHTHGALRACMVKQVRPKVKMLTTLHGPLARAHGEDFPFAEDVERGALAFSDFLVTVSHRTFYKLLGASNFSRPHFVIPNGVERKVMNKNSPRRRLFGNRIMLLTVGSITVTKNQLAIIEAIASSGKVDSFVYFTIGNGPLRDQVEQVAKKSGVLYYNIPWLHYNELPKYYRAANYSILVSISEGFGMCVAESLACGTPVILAEHLDICGEKDIISSRNSVTVDMSNPSALQVLLRMITAGEVCLNESEIDFPYSWDDVANSYESLYFSLVGEGT